MLEESRASDPHSRDTGGGPGDYLSFFCELGVAFITVATTEPPTLLRMSNRTLIEKLK